MKLIRNSFRGLKQVTIASNGVTVITQKSNIPVATVGVVSNGGSRSESGPGEATLNRSITLNNAKLGAGFNVSSVQGRERTGVYATCLAQNAGTAAEALVEAANARTITDQDREHALNSLNAASSNNFLVVNDYAHMAGFQCTPLANSPFGTTDGIQNGSAESVMAFRDQHYGGLNVAIVGTGNVDHDALVEAAAALPGVEVPESVQSFHDMGVSNHRATNDIRCQFTGTTFEDRNDFLVNAWATMLFHVPGVADPECHVNNEVLKQIFGSFTPGQQHAQWSSNQAVKNMCDVRPTRYVAHGGHGDPYSIRFTNGFSGVNSYYTDCSLLGFQVEAVDADSGEGLGFLSSNRLMGVCLTLHKEIKRWKQLNDYEVAAAVNKIRMRNLDEAGNPVQLADHLAACEFGQALSHDEMNLYLPEISAKSLGTYFYEHIFNQANVQAYYGATDGRPDVMQMTGHQTGVPYI